MKKYVITMFCICLLSIGGCDQNLNDNKASVNTAPSPPPRILVLQDLTGSANWTGTPIIGQDDLKALIGLLYRRSGEIAFGFITDKSNRPLIRLQIDPPPVKPEAPSTEGNPLKAADRFNEFNRQMKVYESDYAVWKVASDEKTRKFLATVASVLASPPKPRSTDIWGAVARLDLFFSEDTIFWKQTPVNYACLITDGLHNNSRRKARAPMQSKVKLLLVNATGSVGDLEQLETSRFESLGAAINSIIYDAERGR
ncbi:MAG: hypothetical protein JW884_01255 [Deltaproteobacteria bacterium]|nr:hypothetical protein [Deltaproteobacteria bacterium]